MLDKAGYSIQSDDDDDLNEYDDEINNEFSYV